MGYVDQGCRNIAFTIDRDGKRLWLSAECRRDNGKWRTSKIDLNKCIGPSARGSDSRLEALSGWKAVTLTHGGGKGNGTSIANLICSARFTFFSIQLHLPEVRMFVIRIYADWTMWN
jgi:hypothetical protein